MKIFIKRSLCAALDKNFVREEQEKIVLRRTNCDL